MPIKNSITPQDAVDALNEFFKRDPKAIHCLVCNRVPASDDAGGLASQDCEAQVDGQSMTVGMLGIINGLFGTDNDGYGAIAIEYTDSPPYKPMGFCLLDRK